MPTLRAADGRCSCRCAHRRVHRHRRHASAHRESPSPRASRPRRGRCRLGSHRICAAPSTGSCRGHRRHAVRPRWPDDPPQRDGADACRPLLSRGRHFVGGRVGRGRRGDSNGPDRGRRVRQQSGSPDGPAPVRPRWHGGHWPAARTLAGSAESTTVDAAVVVDGQLVWLLPASVDDLRNRGGLELRVAAPPIRGATESRNRMEIFVVT